MAEIIEVTTPSIYQSINVGGGYLHVTAGQDIPSYHPIAIISGLAYKYDSSNIAHLFAYAGFSTNGVSSGSTVVILPHGLLTLSGWGLTPNTQYIAGLAGAISPASTPVGAIFKKIVGFAVDANTMLIHKDLDPITH